MKKILYMVLLILIAAFEIYAGYVLILHLWYWANGQLLEYTWPVRSTAVAASVAIFMALDALVRKLWRDAP